MSLDPGWLLVAPLLLGHLALSVVVVNVAHALGLSDPWVDRLRLVLVAAIVGIAALLVHSALAAPPPRWPGIVQVYAGACLATLLAGLPLTTLLRLCRRTPQGIAGRVTEVDLAALKGKETLVGPGKYSWLLKLPGNESFRLQTTEWEVPIARLPRAWDGLSVLHVSDLHLAPCFDRRFFEAVAEVAAGCEADLVAFTGDLIDHEHALDWIVPVLSPLRGRLGTFAILGNHDRAHPLPRIRRAVRAAGFTDLEGRWTTLAIEGATLAVGGTAYPWGPGLNPQAMPDADFRLVLSHSPDQFPRAARWGVDLVLSGHNHAGQIRLPLVGPIFMPSLYSRRFDRGFFRAGPSLLYVSQGVAGKHPYRYGGCLPELTRLVLRAEQPVGESGVRAGYAGQALDSAPR